MQTIRGSAGGIAAAPILRARAVDKYYQSPNVCRNCNKVIMVTDNEKVQFARRRKFCNHSCAAQSNNAKRPKKEIVNVHPKQDREWLSVLTKGQLREKYKTYQSFRSMIRRHANKIFAKIGVNECVICGYKNHIEVAHKKSVASFSDFCTISEINDSNNLIGLCPNHHWEYDNGLLKLKIARDSSDGLE